VPLAAAASLNPVNSAVLATALVPIGLGFGVGVGTATSLVAVLYVTSAFAQPVMGRLADRVGPRRVLLAGLVLLVGAGALGTLATNFGLLIVTRVLIGLGTSTGYPSAMTIVRRWSDDHPRGRTGNALGALAVAGQVTAAASLPLGGALVALAGWRAVFAVNIPLALVVGAAILAWVPGDPPRPRPRPPRRSAVRRRPGTALADQRPLMGIYVRVALSFVAIYCVLYGATAWLEQGRGLTEATTGLVMLPGAVVAVVVAIPLARRGLVRASLLITVAATVVGVAGLGLLHSTTALPTVVVVLSVFGVTEGVAMVGNQAMLHRLAAPQSIGTAAGLLRTAMYLGAIAASIIVAVPFHHGADDAGLHTMVAALAVVCVALVGVTLPAVLRRPVQAAQYRPDIAPAPREKDGAAKLRDR
jgi:MFS family permease